MRTHRHLGNGEALMLLGGVHPDYKGAGIAPLMSFHEYNELLRQGIRRITTHVSARNYAILNLEMSALRYRVVQTFVVLRKVYAG
jgi:ribosomal protein S18 acetylase RimI-like enzyme